MNSIMKDSNSAMKYVKHPLFGCGGGYYPNKKERPPIKNPSKNTFRFGHGVVQQ